MGLKPKLLFLILFSYYYAMGFDNFAIGARSAAMGNAAVSNIDVWSAHHNQAALAFYNKFALGLHHETRFLIPENAFQASILTIPVKSGTFGVTYSLFGNKLANDKKFGLAYSMKLIERLAVGVQMDLINTYISQYGKENKLCAEIGILSEPINNLFIGAHVFNPFKTDYNSLDLYSMPSIFRVGASYSFDDKLILNTETEKVFEEKPIYKFGIDYFALYGLYVRLGISSSYEAQYSFGLGYVYKKIYADIGFVNNRELGLTPHLSLCYDFK